MAKCPGSGQSPDRKPRWGDNHRLPCPECGQRVPLYLRRLDWSLASHLKFGDHEGANAATSARVAVWVEVHKEDTNETDPWIPPSSREVAAFLQERASHVETDDGWFVGMVNEAEDG